MTKKIFVILLWVFAFVAVISIVALCLVVFADAQQTGPVSITSTQCATIGSDQMSTVFIQATGTWTGTLTPKASIKGQAAFAINVTPAASSTPQSSITANGGYFARVAGYNYFQLCGNSVASGTAKVYLNASPASH